ncbi:MAG TPA: MtrAB system histidine kinase MtrB [Marmoricola sp.]
MAARAESADRTGSAPRNPSSAPARLASALRRGVADIPQFWRRSLRTRVVVSIVALSAIVVGTVGLLVMRQLSDGLAHSRVTSSVGEAISETTSAQRSLGASGGNAFDPGTQLGQLAETLVARGDARGYDVLVRGPIGPDANAASQGVRTTPGLVPTSVPQRLQKDIATHADAPFTGALWTYTRMRLDASRPVPRAAPAVAVGTTVVLPTDGETYAVYYLFPMTDELTTLHLLRRVLLTSGLLLLLLVAGVTWLVTRQVITPVRLARRVAERIAAGRLEERMHVRGEDDIGRLATSFNQMADELQRQIRQLVDLSRVQRRFVSDVSHELRTPLTTVRMAADVLHDARDSFDPVTARSAELLHTELDRFENLLTDLLEISRFDAGAAALELSGTDLVDAVRHTVTAAAPLADKRGVEVEVTSDGPVVAEVDPRRVERIVRNLVTNAIDHAGGPGARVEVHLAADEDAVAVVVRDYGVGLEPGQQAMVFNRFWRADPARARTSGGTGLGLAIALEDARLHGGWLQAWGAPGEGASFRLTLPRRAGDALKHSPLPLAPEAAGVGEAS